MRGEGGSPEITVATGKEASEPKTYIRLQRHATQESDGLADNYQEQQDLNCEAMRFYTGATRATTVLQTRVYYTEFTCMCTRTGIVRIRSNNRMLSNI